jgi:hypothetical protein
VQVARSVVPPLFGLTAALAIAELAPRPSAPATVVAAPARLHATTARDCEPCHVREVAQWRSSVMASAARSPLVGALESLVEEQVGREDACPHGAGILRPQGPDACFDQRSGVATTGAGGERWCIHCHAPGETLAASIPPWRAHGSTSARAPMRDLLDVSSLEGISCASCHGALGPVGARGHGPRGEYEGNATWVSFETGLTFLTRPEDSLGRTGIGNSGYRLDPRLLLGGGTFAGVRPPSDVPSLGSPHPQPPASTERYLASSEMCGACHDVRLFGTDVLGVAARGEHFKRLRNAYSEWRAWADAEARAGRAPASCQDCHMSLYPGICETVSGDGRSPASRDPGRNPDEGTPGCPPGTRFVARQPGAYATGHVAPSSPRASRVASHWFTGVDLPLSAEVPDEALDDASLDADGVPLGARTRRALLLRHTFRFALGDIARSGARLSIPVVIENVGAGHRVPAGFSQEREIWVELRVTDARGGVVYEVGRLDGPDQDLRDKVMSRVNVSGQFDDRGRPLGLFGANVLDGPDVPVWSPDPRRGGTRFLGRGLVNLQNGFLRCVRCVGFVDGQGRCSASPDAGLTRAGRFADGQYDLDTGECRSNLEGDDALIETYFPVGALDADRGIPKAPDAIIDTRSAPPGVPLTYTYAIDAGTHPAPFVVDARLFFRAFPPYLIRAFAAYEAAQAASGLRPSGAQVEARMLSRDEPVEIGRAGATLP